MEIHCPLSRWSPSEPTLVYIGDGGDVYQEDASQADHNDLQTGWGAGCHDPPVQAYLRNQLLENGGNI